LRSKVLLPYPSVYMCMVKGINDKVREVPALISISYSTSVISKISAAELGYLDATSRLQDLEELYHDRVKYFLTTKGIERAYILKLRLIRLCGITRRNFPVAILDEELNPHLPVDLILGLDFFKNRKISIDTVKKTISILSSE
jgi:hypothetical protein